MVLNRAAFLNVMCELCARTRRGSESLSTRSV